MEKFLRIATKEWLYAKIEEWEKEQVFDEDGVDVSTRISREETRDLAMDIIAWWRPISIDEFNKIKDKQKTN